MQQNKAMTVTYLEHSGFVAELSDRVLVFDYYKGELPRIKRDKPLYVFVSHGHYDHFQEKIFEWQEIYDVVYILSDDIPVQSKNARMIRVKPRQELQVDDMEIKTLRSTDEGAAFLVRMDGICIYHAGDLNWWHWEEEGDVYNAMMERNYKYEVGKLKGIKIDVAFVPLDPRQGLQYNWGLDYFMSHTDTECVFPMHMWGDYSVCDRLLEDKKDAGYIQKFKSIERPGQVFENIGK